MALAKRAGDRLELGELLRALAAAARAQRDRPAVVPKLGPAAIHFSSSVHTSAFGTGPDVSSMGGLNVGCCSG